MCLPAQCPDSQGCGSDSLCNGAESAIMIWLLATQGGIIVVPQCLVRKCGVHKVSVVHPEATVVHLEVTVVCLEVNPVAMKMDLSSSETLHGSCYLFGDLRYSLLEAEVRITSSISTIISTWELQQCVGRLSTMLTELILAIPNTL